MPPSPRLSPNLKQLGHIWRGVGRQENVYVEAPGTQWTNQPLEMGRRRDVLAAMVMPQDGQRCQPPKDRRLPHTNSAQTHISRLLLLLPKSVSPTPCPFIRCPSLKETPRISIATRRCGPTLSESASGNGGPGSVIVCPPRVSTQVPEGAHQSQERLRAFDETAGCE